MTLVRRSANTSSSTDTRALFFHEERRQTSRSAVLGTGTLACPGCDAPIAMRHAVRMRRTTIMLPDELDDRLRPEARRRGTSIADVAREAIERQLPRAPMPGALSYFAVGDGEPDDASEHVDEHVAQAIGRRRLPRL
jgi:hypothetical protein